MKINNDRIQSDSLIGSTTSMLVAGADGVIGTMSLPAGGGGTMYFNYQPGLIGFVILSPGEFAFDAADPVVITQVQFDAVTADGTNFSNIWATYFNNDIISFVDMVDTSVYYRFKLTDKTSYAISFIDRNGTFSSADRIQINHSSIVDNSLSQTLAIGNDSGTYSIIMGSNTSIRSGNGGGQIDLDSSGVAGRLLLSIDNGGWGKSQLDLENAYFELSQYDTGGIGKIYAAELTMTGINVGIGNGGFSTLDRQVIQVRRNSTQSVTTQSSLYYSGLFLNTFNSSISSGLSGTVVIGGQNINGTMSNTVYMPAVQCNDLKVVNGASGTFSTVDLKIVTVVSGIITSIV